MTHIARLMRLATQTHQSNQLEDAKQLYQLILERDPQHAEANHNLAVLAVQQGRYTDSLPYFNAALDADPAHGSTWLNYIEALFLAGQSEEAQQILALVKQQGLTGSEVEALENRLLDRPSPPPTDHPAQAEITKKPVKSKYKTHHGKQPDEQEIEAILALFNAGQIDTVIERARTLTQHHPNHSFGWKALGAALQRQDKHQEALPALQKTVALSPADAEAHNNLGIAQQKLGQLTQAAGSYQKSLRLQPDRAQTHCNLGAVLENLGHTSDAAVCFRRAIALKPDYAKAYCDLGAVLYDLKDYAGAETACRQAIDLIPDYADAYRNLGRTLNAMGEQQKAIDTLQHALTLNPQDGSAHAQLGNLLHQTGKLADALFHYTRAVDLKPDSAETQLSLGVVLHALGHLAEAESHLKQAVSIKPQYSDALDLLGLIQYQLGFYRESEITYRRLLALQPESPQALNGLGNAFLKNGFQLDNASSCYQRALEFEPNFVMAHLNMANVYLETGQLSDASESYKKALSLSPGYNLAHSNLLFCLSMADSLDAQALFEEHCRFGVRIETSAQPRPHRNDKNPDRRLQIGFLSADFREHVIANFFEPLLKHLTDSTQLCLHAYYNYTHEDVITRRIKEKFAHWHPVAHLDDEALAERIRQDGIDILIDLSGHTGHNRLPALALKPAPIQASWMGYPGTTGMRSIDYYFSDRFILPAGEFDHLFTEKIVRLPANAPFLPHPASPEINALPALKNGYLTLGSFNRIGKLNPAVVATWAQILHQLPASRMVVGGLHGEAQYDLVAEWFSAAGIDRDRLQFHPYSRMANYLALHNSIDFCLDTFPYGGGTTTLHAAWMGVPTLTILGNTVASRTGNAALGHLGLDEFITHTPEEFISRGVQIAGNLTALSGIRSNLRAHFSQSAFGQPALIAAGLERSLRTIWQRWCKDLPPVSFDA